MRTDEDLQRQRKVSHRPFFLFQKLFCGDFILDCSGPVHTTVFKVQSRSLRQSTPVQLESSISSFTYLLHFRLPVFPSYPAISSSLGYTCSYVQLDRVFQPHFGKNANRWLLSENKNPITNSFLIT